ncbi:TPA: DUF2800 domain-containing protein, partial [Streptococcus pyogenes]
MPVENHALLSASSAHRWLYCPMLPRLEADYPSRDTVYTQEGTSAHELSEIKLMYKSGKITKRKFNTLTKAFKENSDFYNEEMEEMTELYTDMGLLGYEVTYGHIETGQDFFDYTEIPEGVDCVVSNPPFSKRDAIFDKLYELDIPFALIMNMNG